MTCCISAWTRSMLSNARASFRSSQNVQHFVQGRVLWREETSFFQINLTMGARRDVRTHSSQGRNTLPASFSFHAKQAHRLYVGHLAPAMMGSASSTCVATAAHPNRSSTPATQPDQRSQCIESSAVLGMKACSALQTSPVNLSPQTRLCTPLSTCMVGGYMARSAVRRAHTSNTYSYDGWQRQTGIIRRLERWSGREFSPEMIVYAIIAANCIIFLLWQNHR
jgi:hypothetical protein